MSILNFPTQPGGSVADLWYACMDLVQQLEQSMFVTIKEVTIETTETPVAHGQKFIPSAGAPIARTNVAVWQSSQPDAQFCYFTAASSVVCDVKVFR